MTRGSDRTVAYPNSMRKPSGRYSCLIECRAIPTCGPKDASSTSADDHVGSLAVS